MFRISRDDVHGWCLREVFVHSVRWIGGVIRWLCLLALAAHAQTSLAQFVTNLTVNNSTAVGGTGLAYQVCPGGSCCGPTSGMVGIALQYVDRTFTVNSAVPSNVSGATFIMTANSDKNTNPGSSSYMSFTLTQAATVYIAYCTAITAKPTWLTTNFADTGTSITNTSAFTFELYKANFAAGSTVTLGSNVVTGGNTSQGMYTVILVPRASQPLVSNLVVNNPTSSGGTGAAYQVCPGGSACGTTTGFAFGVSQFLDRVYHINTTVPGCLSGQRFIMTANSDKAANPGAASFLSFTVGQAATVYVAHCTSITTKPSWLTANFTDTGQAVSNDNGFTFELYSRSYTSGSTVTLGSNVPAGGATHIGMYTVIVVPTAGGGSGPPSGVTWMYLNGVKTLAGDFTGQGESTNYENSTSSGYNGDTKDILITSTVPWGYFIPYWAANFALPNPGYTYLLFSLKPTLTGDTFGINAEKVGDVDPDCHIEVMNYGPAAVEGVWGTYKVPLTDLCVAGDSALYKVVIATHTGTPDTWEMDAIGFE